MSRYSRYSKVQHILDTGYVASLNRIEFNYRGPEKFHVVDASEEENMTLVSYKHYKTPLLWWVVALHNNLRNPIVEMRAGMVLKIPTDLAAVEQGITFR